MTDSHEGLVQDLERKVGKIHRKNDKRLKGSHKFDFNQGTRQKLKKNLKLTDPVPSIKSLRQIKTKKPTTECKVPLDDPTTELARRKENSKKIKESMNMWQDQINRIKSKKHLKFPYDSTPASMPSTIDWVDDNNKDTETQKPKINNDTLLNMMNQLSDKEKRTLNSLHFKTSLRERRQILKFLEIYGKNRNRIKKIKSKRFHKSLRKKEIKSNQDINIELMQTTHPHLYQSEIAKFDKIRAEERAKLKHQGGSKWRRNLFTQNSKNPQLLEAINQQSILHKHLVEDTKVNVISSESEHDSNDTLELDDGTLLKNPWYNPTSKTLSKVEDIVSEVFPDSKTLKAPSSCLESHLSNQEPTNNQQEQSSSYPKSKQTKNEDLNLTKELFTPKPQYDLNDCNEILYENEDINEAFKDDDIIDEFIDENTVEVNEKPALLPGWGKWIHPRQAIVKTKRVFQPSNVSNVIINEQDHSQLHKHLVTKLPNGFKSEADFQKHFKEPIGQEWNTPHSFNSKIQPDVEVYPGVPIPPLTSEMKMTSEQLKMSKFISSMPKKLREILSLNSKKL